LKELSDCSVTNSAMLQ